jgi:hypothetical protein
MADRLGRDGMPVRQRVRPSLWPRSRWRSSRESSGRRGHDLFVGHVAQVLIDVPAVPEGVLELTVPITPERVLQRLANLGPGGDRPGEHGLRVGPAPAAIARANTASASAMSKLRTTAVPPIEGGARTSSSGNSSARCTSPSSIRRRSDINRPSGVGMRLISSAPKASR